MPIFEGQDPTGAQRHTALTADITMVICLHKCTVCGVCSSLCPALSVERDPFTAEKMSFGPIGCPAEKSGIKCNSQSGQIKWEKSLCDACGVCLAACPEKAILEVTRKLKKDPILPGKITIDRDNCVACRWCEKTCPYDAVEVTKFFEGELAIDTSKCLEDCNACVDVCPGENALTIHRKDINVKGTETDMFKTIATKLCTPRTSLGKDKTAEISSAEK
jgi:4Fe-4S ferredoxin